MATQLVVVMAALGAALCFAASTALKHASASAAPPVDGVRTGQLTRFIHATVTHRLWLAGIACDAIALTLQLVALHLGALAVVQPLLISGLIFALLLRRLSGRHHVTGRQLTWAFVVGGALAAFVAMAVRHQGSGRRSIATDIDHFPALLAAVVGMALAVTCVVLGRRMSSRGASAAVLGVAVGLIYAATAALLKALTDVAVHDPVRVLISWQLYVVVLAGAAGLLLSQLAFQAGPLVASLPATASVDPLASVVIGVAVYDERLRTGVHGSLTLIGLLLVLGVGIVQLARTSEVAADGADPAALATPATKR